MNKELVNKINASPFKAFFAIAGGGQSFIGDYCNISGASNTVIGAIIPYNQTVFEKFIKGKVDTFASQEGARKLAVASFNECLAAGVPFEYAVGVGASSAVGKDGEREGRVHKINIAVHTAKITQVNSLYLLPGRTREEEDAIISKWILHLLAWVTLDIPYPPVPLLMGERFDVQTSTADPSVRDLMKGTSEFVHYRQTNNDILAIYPGSWNPLHDGHRAIAGIATKVLNANVNFELTVKNTDKPELDYYEITKRCEQFHKLELPLVLTKASTFVEKAKLFHEWNPNKEIVFVVGVDTWNRIWETKYGYSASELKRYFTLFKVKFLVFGRGNVAANAVGKEFAIKNEEAADFNSPLSSSELRKKL